MWLIESTSDNVKENLLSQKDGIEFDIDEMRSVFTYFRQQLSTEERYQKVRMTLEELLNPHPAHENTAYLFQDN